MAARTAEQILQDFQTSVSITDPTADTQKGPLYDLVGRPLSQVLNPTEVSVDRLTRVYSSEFSKIGTAEEAAIFLQNWGEAAGLGTPSRVRVYFMRFTRPQASEDIQIPAGTIVSNQNGTLSYITTEAGLIRGNFADTYFNPTRRTFEVALNCIAVENGPEYDIPAGRITVKSSQLIGIDAVENREAAQGGIAAETSTKQIERVREKLTGLAVNTAEGAKTRIRAYNPTLITDVKAVLANDRNLFRRLTFDAGTDYYVAGRLNSFAVDTYMSIVGGETEILLTKPPVTSIASVTLNSVPITSYFLEKDSSPEVGLSAKAKDKLILTSPLLPNDVVAIQYTYNEVIQGIQQNILGITKLKQTDELAREFFMVPINIEITGKALPSYTPSAVQSAIASRLQFLIDTGVWAYEILPEVILQDLKVNVPGLSSPVIRKFQRSTGALDTIEILRFNDNELAMFDANRTVVTIRNV